MKVRNWIAQAIVTVAFTAPAIGQSVPIAELTEGLWAEGRDLDPFGRRPVQLWLPEGTLVFDIQKTDRVQGPKAAKFRSARTFHGYPVNLELLPKRGVTRYRSITARGDRARFRLLQSVYCPGETNPFATVGQCQDSEPVGEGWVFELIETGVETSKGKKLQATAYPDEKTIAELGPVASEIYTFDIYENDLDRFENQGVLFRLDRKHPLTEFEFIDDYYFPCNTTKTVEFKEEQIIQAFAEASVETEIGFWSWFKLSADAGGRFEDSGSSIKSNRTQQDSSKASVFSQWGLMKTAVGEELPFFVEKRFECQSGVGSTKPGDWITSVEISFWNDNEVRNDVYEFNVADNWVKMDRDEIKKRHQRPVFFSVNDSTKQAQVIQSILNANSELNYNQAVFMFAQLNNGCTGKFRKNCDEAAQVVFPGPD